MSKSTSDAKLQIILTALSLLKEKGIEGLTMRQVAKKAGKSLGNLQHHFLNKKILLDGMAMYYFEECDNYIDNYQRNLKRKSLEEDTKNFILFLLKSSEEVSDMCLIFREMWALSVRDSDIENKLTDYYRHLIKKVAMFWESYENHKAEQASIVLLPYLDGYSIQNKAIDIPIDTIAQLLTENICNLFKSE